MRLIDSDKLWDSRFELYREISDKDFGKLARWLKKFPTEKAVPLSVIEKIKAEIEISGRKFDAWNYDMVEVSKVISIIDQAIKECDTNE